MHMMLRPRRFSVSTCYYHIHNHSYYADKYGSRMIRCSRPASRGETLQLLRKVRQPLLPDFPSKRHRRLLGALDLAHLQPPRHRRRHDLSGMSMA